MKSILMIGQSNMAGRGFIADVAPLINEHVFMLRNGRWQMMAEPINPDRSVAGISLAATFADAWSHDNPGEQIGLIPCAEGGSSLEDWNVDGHLFRHALSEARFAMETSEIIGILWHQGESDSHSGLHQSYYDKLSVIMRTLKDTLQLHAVPLIIGELGDFLGKSGFGLYSSEYKEINHVLRHYTNDHTNTYIVSSQLLTSNPDGIHMDAVSLRRFGLRYYAAFKEQKNVDEPLKNEMDMVMAIESRTLTPNETMHDLTTKLAEGKIDYQTFTESLTGKS